MADRLGRTGVEIGSEDVGTDGNQVRTDLFQVDFPGDTIARYEIDNDGRRSENTPSEVYSLSDVLDIHEAANVPEAAPASEEAGQSETESSSAEPTHSAPSGRRSVPHCHCSDYVCCRPRNDLIAKLA